MYMLIGGDLVRVALFFMLVRLVSACHSRVEKCNFRGFSIIFLCVASP